ncbi:MAG: phosphoglycerate dehydrogenase [Rhodospirillales bacterium]|nr:phosphoglycerate dehydrogenase [Rhodospirillales bacterium]MBO6787695.1 phosphoglycerate dehydrogenase [Rhodospirillales bacterium]
MSRVCVASRSFSRHPVLRAELTALYPDAKFNDAGESLAGDRLTAFLKGHDKAVIALEKIDGATLDALPELKVIAKYGVGFDKIDLHALIERGVSLGWTGGVNRRSVAELVIAFAISLLRHVPTASAEVLDGTWRQTVGRQLSDCTVGIVGCGHVGKELAHMLRAGFGAEVLAHDLVDFSDFYAEHGIIAADLATLLSQSDVVSLHLPLDTTTKNIVGADALAQMKPSAVLINTARGGLVDEDALKGALQSGHLAAAAFDVFAAEPPEDTELLNLPNFLATPHIGGSAEEAILAMGRAAIRGLDAFRPPEPGIFPPGRW